MKTKLIIATIACASLMACNNNEAKKNTGADAANDTVPAQTSNVIRKPVIVTKEFNHITNISTADIVFTHGDYSVEIEGDKALVDYVKTEFDSNLLTVSMGTDANLDYNKFSTGGRVTLYISAPSLSCLAICNAGSFTCTDKWKNDEIQIAIFGTGKTTLADVECDKLLIEASECGDMTIGHLKADIATLNSRNDGTFTIDCDVNDFTIMNTGKQTINLTGRIGQKSIQNKRDPKLNDSTN